MQLLGMLGFVEIRSSDAFEWLTDKISMSDSFLVSRRQKRLCCMGAGPRISHVIFAFCNTAVLKNAKIRWEIGAGAELGIFHVISAFCATGVPQKAEITRKSPSTIQAGSTHFTARCSPWQLAQFGHHSFCDCSLCAIVSHAGTFLVTSVFCHMA